MRGASAARLYPSPHMKIATWNVNSITARLPQALDWVEANRPDALCLQETKCVDAKFPFDAFREIGYTAEVFGQPTYNGVAILSLQPATDPRRGLPDDTPEARARLEQIKEKTLQHLGDYVYADDNRSLESCVLRLLSEDGGELTLAEVGSGGSLTAALLGEGDVADLLVTGAFSAPRFDELRQLLQPLPQPWDAGATTVDKTTLLAEAAAARTQSLWVIVVGEVRKGKSGHRYVDVVSKRRGGLVDHQQFSLRGSGEYARVRLTTRLLDYLRRRLTQ